MKKKHPQNRRKRPLALDCPLSPKRTKTEDQDADPVELIEYLRQELNLALLNQNASTLKASKSSDIPEGLSSLFSPDASEDQLLQQLELLKSLDATVAGIPLEGFKTVKSIDLAKSQSPICFPPDCLVVLGGEHHCKEGWLCFQDTTFIGKKAAIRLGKNAVIYPDTEEVRIVQNHRVARRFHKQRRF